MQQKLQLDDIQGFVVRGYSFLYARYVFVQFKSATQGKQWLAQILDWTTPATRWTEKPKVCQNIAFTYEGFKALEFPDIGLKSFSQEFREGMHNRSRMIGDMTPPNRPENWELGKPNPESPIHALLLLFGFTAKDLNDFSARHEEVRAKIGGIEVLHTVDGIRRLDKKEQFGFLDGASQPLVEGTREAEDNFDPNSPTRAVKAGEFVLGYYNEYGVIPPSPVVPASSQTAKLPDVAGQSNVRDFGKNGTYLVCRKLYQDVAGFRKFLKDNSGGGGKESSAEIEAFAAKLVGRWRSGTPISLSPERDEPAHSANDFTFGDDPEGLRCPIGSHIRRANPRDTFGLPEAHGTESLKTINRHRILRRGMPYGPVLQGDRDDSEDRGLMFICVNADIAVQYEFVQRWMNDPSFNGLYQDQDVFSHTHNGTTATAVPDNPVRRRVIYTQNFITIKGGGYFFMPGMNALRYLAGV